MKQAHIISFSARTHRRILCESGVFMKRVIALLLTVIAVFCLCSCNSQTEIETPVSGATDDEANYPTPENENFVETDTGTGMRYKMTLDQYTTAFNTMYTSLGGSLKDYPYKKWKKMYSGLSKGVKYDYYYLDSGKITLTATVEQKSLYLANVGCGVTKSDFVKSKDTEQNVMTVCGIMAAVAGGYTSDAVIFFGNLYVDTINSEEHCFAYGNSVYLYDINKSSNGTKTMLFRTMPAAGNIKSDWNITDYKTYWLGN